MVLKGAARKDAMKSIPEMSGEGREEPRDTKLRTAKTNEETLLAMSGRGVLIRFMPVTTRAMKLKKKIFASAASCAKSVPIKLPVLEFRPYYIFICN